jgi:hypothetical protein
VSSVSCSFSNTSIIGRAHKSATAPDHQPADSRRESMGERRQSPNPRTLQSSSPFHCTRLAVTAVLTSTSAGLSRKHRLLRLFIVSSGQTVLLSDTECRSCCESSQIVALKPRTNISSTGHRMFSNVNYPGKLSGVALKPLQLYIKISIVHCARVPFEPTLDTRQ